MEEHEQPPPARPVKAPLWRRLAVAATGAGVLGAAAATGVTIAGAASSPSPTPTAGARGAGHPGGPWDRRPFDPTQGGHVGANGVVEKLLAGTTAEKARAAALAAVPGGTIQRVETDAEGAVYEAHMLRSDGTPVTVKMDANFKVTGIENGPGAPPRQPQP
jgi:peptidase YpeB-like protein